MSEFWEELKRLARNFWWCWNPNAERLFHQLDPDVWEASHHSPVAILDTLGERATLKRLHETDQLAFAEGVLLQFDTYLDEKEPWRDRLPIAPQGTVAYLSAEYGVQESLHIYAGGLGILAADHCKSASDLGVPMVAVGLLYREGYFTQLIDKRGRQQAYYRRNDFWRMGLELVCDDSGRFIILSIPGIDGEIGFSMWRTDLGRVPLILLDAGLWQNRARDRQLTLRLYGGDQESRIRQEILLGVGGVRALRYLGIEPTVFHMNEGHTAFATLELIRERMAQGEDFETAQRAVHSRCVFTTHTPVAAGHDRFAPDLLERHLGWLRRELDLDERTFYGLGRVNVHDDNELFCMTVLGMRMARAINGVSDLHGQVTREMWRGLWPDRPVDDVPITHITNGVHIPTWMAPEMGEMLDSQLGESWRDAQWDPEVWEKVLDIPDSLFWAVHMQLKRRLIHFARARAVMTRIRQDRRVMSELERLDPEALTIGFARRFATYKRGDLLFRDWERAKRLLANPDRPVQIFFAGKAHPQDIGGGEIIARIIKASRDPVLSNHVFFIPDYSIEVAKYLVRGVDLWLNTPRRPREASGTSGQKVPLNGGINASTVDGWWCEGFNGANGWNIGDTHVFPSDWEQDQRDLEALYYMLESEIVPLFYDRDVDGIPRGWIGRMKESMRSIAWRFGSDRMVRDYVERLYWPSVTGELAPDDEGEQ
jgi:starch phosphorylase